MADIRTECFYKQGEHIVIFNENNIKIGTKSISTEDIYHINVDYITNYERLFKVATVVTSAVATALFFALAFNQLNILVAMVVAFFVSIYAYIIKPRNVIKNNPDKYIKMIDIFHDDKHDAFLVRADCEFDPAKYIKLKKTMVRSRTLRYYKTRMIQSRKYLVQQIENNGSDAIDVIHEKYATVAEHRHRQEHIFSKRLVEILCNAYHDILGKDLKISIKISTITLIMLVGLVIHVALSKDFSYSGFF